MSFALSRVVFWHMGVRYDSSSLDCFWQYLDLDVLRHRLLPGIFHLHSQPPAFNLFLGTVLKLSPDSPSTCFHLVYMALGFLLYCSLFYFLRLARFSRFTAFLCAFVFIISPNSILYENWLFYTYPVAVLLALAALALRQFEKFHTTRSAVVFLVLLMLVCLTRSAFHLLYLLVATGFVLIPPSGSRRRICVYALAVVSVVLGLYLRTFCLFGCFGPSSWGGMNLAKLAQHSIGTNTISRMVSSGQVPEIAQMAPFQHIEKYPEYLRAQAPDCPELPELSAQEKASGHPNFNHPAYIPVSRAYWNASVLMIRHNFRYYLSGVFDSWMIYCAPSWHYVFLKSNRSALSDYIAFLSAWRMRVWIDVQPLKSAMFGVSAPPILIPLTGLLIPLILLTATVTSAVIAAGAFFQRRTVSLSYVFMTYTVLYVAILGNAVEWGENNRFRVMTDPLIFLLTVLSCRMVFRQAVRMLRRSRCQQSPSPYPEGRADAPFGSGEA
jgi:hypothetical protein